MPKGQGERNQRVFLKAKVIQASSQLNPDRDKIFKFSGQPLPNPKFGQDNLQKIFRFGALQELTPTLNISQDCVDKNPVPSHFPTSTSFGVPICHSSPAVKPVPYSSSDLERTNPHMELKSTYLPLQINGKIWAFLQLWNPCNRSLEAK